MSDLIDRQAVLKQLKGCLTGGETEYQYVKLHIDSIPPVNPQEPKTGYWIEHEWKELREKGYYRCSVCNHGYQRYTKGIRKSDVPYIDGQEYTLWHIDNYCPNCGAKMFEPQESEG